MRASGVLYVTVEVTDGTNPVTLVQPGIGYFHSVRIENITRHPMDAYVVSRLPNRTQHLAFVRPRKRTLAHWQPELWADFAWNIPHHSPATLTCEIVRSGSGTTGEPIQCDEVWAFDRTQPNWNKLNRTIPFNHAVDVA